MPVNKQVIVLESVFKIYESKGGRVPALKGISLSISSGEKIVIMGPSGSGKTTLLNLIAGIDNPTSGRIKVMNLEIQELAPHALSEFRLKNIGYVFQFFNLIPTLTVIENVMTPMIFLGKSLKEAKKRANELLVHVGLENKKNMLPGELSGGELQRAAIATALANDPPIILADEPTGELDLDTGMKIIELLVRVSAEKGKTLIISTHDPRITRFMDRIVLLEDGLIKGEYSPTTITRMSATIRDEDSERIRDFLEKRIESIDKEIQKLIVELEEKQITLEEFVEKANKLRVLRDSYKEELTRLGYL